MTPSLEERVKEAMKKAEEMWPCSHIAEDAVDSCCAFCNAVQMTGLVLKLQTDLTTLREEVVSWKRDFLNMRNMRDRAQDKQKVAEEENARLLEQLANLGTGPTVNDDLRCKVEHLKAVLGRAKEALKPFATCSDYFENRDSSCPNCSAMFALTEIEAIEK